MQHLQKAFHLIQGLFGPHDAGTHGLGTVHGRAAAESDQPLAAVFQVQFPGFLHVGHGGVGHGTVVDHTADMGSLELLFQVGGQAQAMHTGIGDQHDAINAMLPQHGGHTADAFDQFGLAVGQKGQRNAHAQLKSTAENLLDNVHFPHPFPLWTL